MSVLAPLNTVECSVGSFNNPMAVNHDFEAMLQEIHDYKSTVWNDFCEEYYMIIKNFFPFQVPPKRKITYIQAKKQLKDFVTLHPYFRGSSIEKIMSKLIYYFVPNEMKDQVVQMLSLSFTDGDCAPMTDDETPTVRRNAKRSITSNQHNMLTYSDE